MAEVSNNPPETANTPSEGVKEEEVQTILPLEVIDKAVGTQVQVLLTNDKEFKGTLAGFDDFVNIVLENVSEFDNEGKKDGTIKRMLLNGGQIAMIVSA